MIIYVLLFFVMCILQITHTYPMTVLWGKWICALEKSVFIPTYKKRYSVKQALHLFLQKYAPPKAVVDYLNAQTKAFFKECVTQKLPKQISIENKLYWIKGRKSKERIFNALRLKELIKRENLTRLDVVKKYIYCKNNTCITIAEHVEKDYAFYDYDKNNNRYIPKKSFFDLEITKQLSTLVISSGFVDWALCHNVVIDKDQKIIFIDTEDRSFFDYKTCAKSGAYICHAQVLKRMIDFLSCNDTTDVEMWVKEYINNELDCCKNDSAYCKHNRIVFLPRNSNLDPVDFDLNIVRNELMVCKNKKMFLTVDDFAIF